MSARTDGDATRRAPAREDRSPARRGRALAWTLVALTALGLGPTFLSAQAAGSDEAALETVRELRESYIAAFNAHDAAGAASHFAREGVLLPPYAEARQGKEAVRRRLQGLFDAQDVAMQMLREGAWTAGDRVVERGLLFLEIHRTEPGGRPTTGGDTGKYVLVARRTSEGWRIEWLIWNQDHPPEEDGGAGS